MLATLGISSCQHRESGEHTCDEKPRDEVQSLGQVEKDSIIVSKKHKPSFAACDLDGDNLTDTVQIVQNTTNEKYGLKIVFGNKRVELLGMSKKFVGQEFDDISWVDAFEVAPKGKTYWNNVSDEGEIISEEDVKDSDKIKLLNDGIFIHQAEACGGGVVYFENGKFEWIQQD